MSSMTKTKAKSKAARRRRGADTSKISLAGATANNPRTQGSRPKTEDPRKVALAKRAADCGVDAKEASLAILGHDLGRCKRSHPLSAYSIDSVAFSRVVL